MLSFNWAGWFLEMVAFGHRKDFFAVFARGAFPQEMPHAQKLKRAETLVA